MIVRGLVGSIDGKTILADEVQGTTSQAEELGVRLAERLLDAGADKILEAVYGQQQ